MDNIGGIRPSMTGQINQSQVPSQQVKPENTTPPAGDQVQLGMSDTPVGVPKKWCLMHYTAADNNLLPYLKSDVNEMEAVGSTANMHLVVQLDEGSHCERYYLNKDSDPKTLHSPVLENMGKIDMADPKVLADFIKFAAEKYPAEHYALVIGDHGGGWQGAISDDSHGTFMSTPDIRKAIEMSGQKIDVLGFDCCMMATTEVATEMGKAGVDYMVASAQNEGGDGWSYTPLLTKRSLESFDRALRSRLNIPPDEFAIKMVKTAEGDQASLPTLSATDLSKMNNVMEATNAFAEQLINTGTSNDILKDCIRKSEYYNNGLRDQFHFAEIITQNDKITDEGLKEAAKGMMAAIKDAVIAEEHSGRHPNHHGLSAELPTYGGVRRGYKDLEYAKQTQWDEAMDKIHGKIMEHAEAPQAQA